MPMIRVQMFPGRTRQQKQDLVRELTDAIVETCAARREDVWVIIDEVDRDRWASAGTLYSEL